MLLNIPTQKNLGQLIDEWKEAIDTAAGDARSRYITDISGQQAVYLEKKRQADEYIENLPEDMDGLELIVAEAQARNCTYLEAASLVIGIAGVWNKSLSPEIERIRIGAKNQIDLLPIDAEFSDVISIGQQAVAELSSI